MTGNMKAGKAALYHFTDKSEHRPSICQKEIERIRNYAATFGYTDVDVYMDRSLRISEQKELEGLLKQEQPYPVLFLKDFYHLHKNTESCMDRLVGLVRKGTKVHTLEDGDLDFCEASSVLGQPLRVAMYYCGLKIVGRSAELQREIMDLFVRTKTRWIISDYYADLQGNKVNGAQKEMERLINERESYDIILVQSFGGIHWRTARFCKIRHLLGKPIYSMQKEIILPYGGDIII